MKQQLKNKKAAEVTIGVGTSTASKNNQIEKDFKK